MTEQDREAQVGRDATNDKLESHFSFSKLEVLKYGPSLSTLNAGGVATFKSIGWDFWDELDDKMQDILVLYAEHLAKETREQFRRDVEAYASRVLANARAQKALRPPHPECPS